MKKILFFSIILSSFLSNAQFSLLDENSGNAIVDGSIITVTQDQLQSSIIMTNTSSSSYTIMTEIMSISNTDGSELTYCFGNGRVGNCNTPNPVGSIYNGGSLAPGAATSTGDIDLQHSDENPNFATYPKDYVIKIYAEDAGAQVGSAITFTYRYSPGAAVNDSILDNNFSVFANAQKQLVVKTENNVSFTMFNLTGQQVINTELSRGMHRLSIAKLPAGIYMVYAKTSNKQIYRKVVIQ
jgi:hypothetical protein